MTRSERDLVTALRAELAGLDPARPCDRAAEADGLGVWSTETGFREGAVARLAVRLRHGIEPPSTPGPFDWDQAADHCRAAWLRGRFLARGSLSLASGRTHAEFVVEAAEAPVLARRLALLGLPASWRLRRGRGVVTWKSGETIGLFLRRIGAGATLLELEARQVSRALRGDLNRVLNAESANLLRAVSAAGRQLDAIAVLASDGRLSAQPEVVRRVAAARQATPEATLSDLADTLAMHRSTVQRALERLEHLANDEGTRPARTPAGLPSPGTSARSGRSGMMRADA